MQINLQVTPPTNPSVGKIPDYNIVVRLPTMVGLRAETLYKGDGVAQCTHNAYDIQ